MKDMTGILQGCPDIMSDHNDRDLILIIQPFNQAVHLLRRVWIQTGYRLIEEQKLSCRAESPG